MKEIEIKPNDQSWVGKKIRRAAFKDYEYLEILYVGNDSLFCIDEDEVENSWSIDMGWRLYEQPKKKVLLAPALRVYDDGDYGICSSLYSSESQAKKDCVGATDQVIWPAIPNADGFYEVEESDG